MLSNFSFVVPSRLAGSAHPGWGRELETNARELAELHGITLVATLTEESIDPDALHRAGLDSLHMPIPDMTPPTMADATQLVERIEQEIENGGRVVVHCLGGYGRTGTILACYLVALGRSAEEAVRTVRKLRPGSIETLEQERFVAEFANHRQSESDSG